VILVFVEQSAGRPDRGSLEALAVARRLGADLGRHVGAVLIGSGAREAAATLGPYGVAVAHVADDPRLEAYAAAAWAQVVVQVMAGAAVVLAGGSERGNEIMAHVGARTGLPMAANCVEIRPGERWEVVRQRWAGSLLEEAWLDGDPRLLTVAANTVPVDEPGPAIGPAAATAPEIRTVTAAIAERDLRARVTGTSARETAGVSQADARVVIGGGRGVGGAEGFGALDDLAGLLGAAVGVSRVATSAGWRPHSDQIGQTGQRIAPDLYIACGISGAIQHIVGCRGAKRILAINTDPDAPIMSRASYAVIGDLHAVVPAISAEIRRTGRATAGET
jgi:electron transfer flavoprotein alpha subunit